MWKGYPNRKNSWEVVDGLENAEDLVQAWWNNNMPREEFPTVFSASIFLYALLLRRIIIYTILRNLQ